MRKSIPLKLVKSKPNISDEESFKFIFENSLNEIYIFDATTYNFIYVNRGACKNLGYLLEELKRLTPLDIKPELTHKTFNELLEPLRSGKKEIIQFETVHQRKNGSFYFVEVQLQMTTFLAKPAFVTIILDVTDRKEIEDRLNFVIQGADLGYWDWDYSTNRHQVNDRWLEMLGIKRGDLDLYENNWGDLLHQDDRKRVRETIKQSIENKKPYTVEFRVHHYLGHWLWVRESGAVVEYDTDNKTPLRLCGTYQDISLRKQSEEQIRKLSRAIDQSPNLVFITDINGKIEYVNPKLKEITGYSSEEVQGKNPRIFKSGQTQRKDYKELWDTIKSGEVWRGTFHNKRKDGSLFWSQQSIAPIKDENNNVTHFIATQEDITKTKQFSEKLNYQAAHDPLTGLVNRREFENRVNRVIDTARQDNSKHVLCFLDLDQFKIINDTCTHVAGDELLKQIAGILESTFRHRDSIGRLGGDEFAVLLEHCSVDLATKHAQELLDAVNNFQFRWENKSFRVGVSIGIVAINSQTQNFSELLTRSDIACYAAKHSGRNCFHIYQESDYDLSLGHKELQWISIINEALDENHLVLYAQPICQLNAQENTPKHYEILLRLQDNEGKIIAPGAFLPTVERFNLSLQLDQWVIKSSVNWIKKTMQQNYLVPDLSINLSGQNLGNQQFLGFIKKQFEKYPEISTEKICFEITETLAINNLTDANLFITDLKEYGFKFSLDDFGSGLSSFEYLKNLPVDFLKIDGQFVRNIVNDPIDLAMVKSINEIGHVMGKQTIAEFVENEQILELLANLKIDYVQGYYLGKPQPIDSFLESDKV